MDSIEFSKDELYALTPSYVCRFPYETHPDAAKAEVFARDYIATRWPWPSEEAKQRFLKLGLEPLISVWHPQAKDELVGPASLWACAYFLIDDLMEEVSDEGQSVARLFGIILGTIRPKEGDIFEEVVFDIHERCRLAGNEVDLERVQKTCEVNIRWMKHVLKKSRSAIQGSELVSYETFEEFMAERKQEVGSPVVMPFARWVCDIEPPQAILEHSTIKAIETIALTHATYVNDLYSLRKELKEVGEKKRANMQIICSNAILYLSEKNGCSISDAMKELEGRIEGLDSRFVEEAGKAKLAIEATFGKEALETIGEYIEMIERFIAGNVAWHAQCGRYNDLGLYHW